MESKFARLGTSIKVPIVQELAKKNLDRVPSRYIRSDNPPCLLSSSPQIPHIDMQRLLHPDSMDSELNKLHAACKEWGFFQLINHGVDPEVVEKMKMETRGFFDLPIEEKNKFYQEEGDIQGYGQNLVVSDDQKLDWADLLTIITAPAALRKPHLIPKLPASFREALEAYSSKVQALTTKMLNMLTRALGMKHEEMEAFFGGALAMQSMKLNYYPPCPQPELVTGLAAHSDASALTVLLQANESDGLQINKDGNWIPISPHTDAFIINIGDTMEILSNGVYRSIEHRVVVNSEKERLSIATFLHPNLDSEVGPAPSLVCRESPPKFKRIGAADFLKGFVGRKLEGKSNLDSVRI